MISCPTAEKSNKCIAKYELQNVFDGIHYKLNNKRNEEETMKRWTLLLMLFYTYKLSLYCLNP